MTKKALLNPSGDLDVLNCVSLRVRMLNRIVSKLYSEPLKDLGISTCQQNILFMLGKAKTLPQNVLGKLLYLERSSVTRELNGLIEKKYIKKTTDYPSPILALTKSGQDMLKIMMPRWRKMQTSVLDTIGNDGSRAIDDLIQSLRS